LYRSVYVGEGSSCLVGNDAISTHESVSPILHQGTIVNFDAFEKVMNWIYKDLKLKPEEIPVIISSHLERSKSSREKVIQIMFETFNIPAYYSVLKPILCLYASGLTAGLSITFGHDLFTWMPLYEGHAVTSSAGTIPLAGEMITNRLVEVLKESNPFLEIGVEVADQIKREFCYVSQNYELETQLQQTEEKIFRNLRNGQEIRIKNEMYRAPEIVFKPSFGGMDVEGIHHHIADSILSAPMDMRKCLQSFIVLNGGSAKLKGVNSRLSSELKEIDFEVFGNCKISSGTDNSSWVGGSIMAGLSSLPEKMISSKEYSELGPSIVNRKCFLF